MIAKPLHLRAVAFLLVCGFFVTGCAGATEPVSTTVPNASLGQAPLVPDQGVYLGLFYGDGSIDETNRTIGRVPQIHLTYFGWNDAWTTDPTLVQDLDRGQISLVNWEPFDADFADIVAGEFDSMLIQRAEEAARLAAPVFVDFAAEMNEEEGWGGHDADLYIAAYRHVHDIFSARDSGNVVWVWAPNNVDSQDAPAAMDYYPGDAYVDWTGIDGYNWGTSDAGFEWQNFEGVFRDLYDDLHRIGKPIIIAETASAEEGGSKAEWIRDIVPTLQSDFSDIRALVWFDIAKERDWRIASSPDAAAAMRDLAAASLFRTSEP